jgi:hypothetical protein
VAAVSAAGDPIGWALHDWLGSGSPLTILMEVAMRPLLFDIAGQLGDVPIDDRGRLPLQHRLVMAVPTSVNTAVRVEMCRGERVGA